MPYRKKQLRLNLFLGSIWSINFGLKFFLSDGPEWFDYFWLVLSLFYFSYYLYQNKYGYVNIKNGMIMVDGPWGKKVNLSEVKRIKPFAGDLILKTDHKDLHIISQQIEPDNMKLLQDELEQMVANDP